MSSINSEMPAICPSGVMVGGSQSRGFRRLWAQFGARISAAWRVLELMDQVRTERRALARLGDRDFADMGIDRATAVWESERVLTDLPAERLRRATAPAAASQDCH